MSLQTLEDPVRSSAPTQAEDALQPTLSQLESAVEAEPRETSHYLALARMLAVSGSAELACVYLECALILSPQSADVREGIAAAYSVLPLPRLLPAALVSELSSRIARVAQVRHGKPVARSAERALVAAIEQHRKGNLSAAEASYRKVLKSDPAQPQALFWLGTLALETGRVQFAVDLLSRAVAAAPDIARYHSNLGEALAAAGELGRSVESFQRALALEPEAAEGYYNLALALSRSGSGAEAVAALKAAVRAAPGAAPFRLALARELENRGQLLLALAHYRAAMLASETRETLLELARASRRVGRSEAAVRLAEQALRREPNLVAGWLEIARGFSAMQRSTEATTAYGRVLELEPRHARACSELALLVFGEGNVQQAVELWERAVALDPSDVIADSNRVYALEFRANVTGPLLLKASQEWAQRHEAPLAEHVQPHPNERSPDRRLKLGFVGSAFREHAQALYLAPLLEQLDREQFEVHCYSGTRFSDRVTERLSAGAEVWREVAELDDLELARLIRLDCIDVLVDLNMHMAESRLRAFACKPAPVQICWLAYPGTTGLRAMDYRVTDPWLDPRGAEQPSTEALLVLPETFWAYDPHASELQVAAPPCLRNGYVTFGNLNGPWKVNERVIALWARVLKEVEGARLRLLAPGLAPSSRDAADAPSSPWVAEQLERAGIARERLELVPRSSRRVYLEYYSGIDLGLDTLPYGGHTTSLDAFWMGSPVLTLPGTTCAGRAGVSLAQQCGFPELVAESEDDFVARAVDLARDHSRLAELRYLARARLEASAFMRTGRFARHFGQGLRLAFQRYCEGLAPARLEVPALPPSSDSK